VSESDGPGLGGGDREVARFPDDELASAGDRVRFDYQTPLGRSVEGVAIRVGDEVVAFENVCPHLGMPLDCHTGEFLSDNGQVLLCDAHGARFEPESGRCTVGPCQGDRLETLRVRRAEQADEWIVLRGRGLSR